MTAAPTDRIERSGPRGMTPERQRIAAEALQSHAVFKALASFGDFYAFVVSVFRKGFTRTFQFREFVSQAWFITTVSFWPALLVAIPFCVVIIFQVNQLLIEIGAVDLAGAGAAVAVVREIGPIVSVLVVAGAGATAICADLGSRKIREEIDAMTTLGIDPIQRLVVPRVVASTLVGIALNGLVTVVGLVGGYFFSVVLQGATPGLYLNDLTLLVGLSDFIAAEAKAAVFGLLAGLTACYLGLNAKGGPKGVGEAVNQTVVFAFMLLFAANSVISTLFLQLKQGS
ncbi:phospholipid/cholesterol/gamma-HCH transport system permease protein [Nocardioides luteus]|uniref:ABC transporter permease n=2 Tax=Nocardioides luteus TaxID=1844 RepID=A0ABQ5STR7_9ACTN|nr:phospholipid/cholesterol/gamma-HCH transport system permease protein [Nocardioides luteus]GLJ66938.1 ABC transporter permease [Nocardioides luteus]